MLNSNRPALIFMWEQFAPYHIDRLRAIARQFGSHYCIVGIEVASRSETYAWKPATDDASFERHLLFADELAERVPWRRKLVRSLQVIRQYRASAVFLCNQDHKEIIASLVILRLLGIRVYAMLDAKFDDRPRRVLHESSKQLVLRLFHGGIATGARQLGYYRFLGLSQRWIVAGYQAVSVDRVRQEAARPLAPEGKQHADRDFVVVARFVLKKDLITAIRAYNQFKIAHPLSSRRLVLCGSGELESQLRDVATEGVVFAGFLDSEAISQTVADSLALVLPSVEEQWGLVVNEAVALGIPVLCSDNVGARDVLVRTGVNGFIFEPGNDEGLARLLGILSEDEELWREMSLACRRFAPLCDVPSFVRGVGTLIGTEPP